MLTASAASPNIPLGENSRPAPKPENWHGVAEGLNRARKHVSDGSFQPAIDTLKEILEFAPSEPQAWRLLGDILGRHGHAQQAEACHKKAERFEQHAAVDTQTTPASERLAKLLWKQGETDAARAMLAILLLRKPEDEKLLALRESWNEAGNES